MILQTDGVEVHRVGTKPERHSALARFDYTVRAWLKLREIIRKRNIELVCASHWGAEGFLCSVFEHVPLVVTTHTAARDVLDSKTYSGNAEYLSLKILSAFEEFTIKRASRVIANSKDTFAHVISNSALSPEKIDIVHHSVDTEQFKPGMVNSMLRKELGISDTAPIALTVGRLEQRKGTHILSQLYHPF